MVITNLLVKYVRVRSLLPKNLFSEVAWVNTKTYGLSRFVPMSYGVSYAYSLETFLFRCLISLL